MTNKTGFMATLIAWGWAEAVTKRLTNYQALFCPMTYTCWGKKHSLLVVTQARDTFRGKCLSISVRYQYLSKKRTRNKNEPGKKKMISRGRWQAWNIFILTLIGHLHCKTQLHPCSQNLTTGICITSNYSENYYPFEPPKDWPVEVRVKLYVNRIFRLVLEPFGHKAN